MHISSEYFVFAFERIFQALGIGSRKELARVLTVSQSQIARAVRTKNIPDAWLCKLVRKYRINPDWVLTGAGSKYMIPADGSYIAQPLNTYCVEDLCRALGERLGKYGLTVSLDDPGKPTGYL